ncbi:cytochrome P450 monooxygenase pc-3 [Mycena galopus ATCC 62051]|nr:cytochrome P450 monooxygenase pc-3 [Mycena galopus ATCC 62051]
MLGPGTRYLARNAVIYGFPVACGITVVRQVAAKIFDIQISTWILIFLSAASIPVYTTLYLTLRNRHHRREAAKLGARLAPTPSRGKWPGNIDLLIEMQKIWKHGYPGDGLRDVMAEVGPVANVEPLWANVIFTTCPEHIKIILATDFANYEKGHEFRYGTDSVLGTGVFNSDGEMWKFHRSLSRPYFSRDRISHFDMFDRHADDVISLIKERMKSGYAIDFQDLIGRFTMDSATEFLFGSCVNSLHASLPFPHNATFTSPKSESARAQVATAFSAAFNESMLHVAGRVRVGYVWPILEMFTDKTVAPMKIVNAYIDPIIHDAVEKKKLAKSLGANMETTDEEGTLLDELLNVTSDPKVLKDETLNILLAGKDTTQWTVTVIMYFLAMYPKFSVRLREEILAHVGPTRRPTYDDIRDMKFLRAVINEAMRLYPSVPFNMRQCINATTWPSPDPNEKPIYIPAGVQVPYSVLMMHRRKDLWGPDAEEFDPDRWLDERLKTYLLTNSFQFLPFNAGPRICLGQQFAYNEMSFVIIRLLQSFSSVSLDLDAFPPGARPPTEWAMFEGRKAVEKFRPKLHLTMYAESGMWLKMT